LYARLSPRAVWSSQSARNSGDCGSRSATSALRDPVDHLGRGIPLPALLQPGVVVRTDNSQYSDLLTPQTRDAAITAGRQANRRRLYPGSMGTQE